MSRPFSVTDRSAERLICEPLFHSGDALAMDAYRIEKSRIPVVVTLAGGEELAGDMFVQGFAAKHYGPERPSDLLNDQYGFFPLALSDSETRLVNKHTVRDVAELSTSRDDWTLVAGWHQQRVELKLVGGITMAGSVELELAGESPRLLDFLNKSRESFLALRTDEGTRFVNRAVIESIRLLEES